MDSGRWPSAGERGAVALLTALVMVVLLGATALTLDLGMMLLRRREMINGADAAALAGALTHISGGNAQAAADTQFRLNSPGSLAHSPGGITSYPVVITGTVDGGSITVRYTSNQPLYFAPILGFGPTHPITTTATASWTGGLSSFPEVVIPEGYGGAPHDRVYVCKYVGKPGEGERLAEGQNPILVNYNENWDGQTLFLDQHGFSIVIELYDLPGQGPDPEPACPSGPHVWLSD